MRYTLKDWNKLRRRLRSYSPVTFRAYAGEVPIGRPVVAISRWKNISGTLVYPHDVVFGVLSGIYEYTITRYTVEAGGIEVGAELRSPEKVPAGDMFTLAQYTVQIIP